MIRTVAQKTGIKAKSKALFINTPTNALVAINLPGIDKVEKPIGDFNYIPLFFKSQVEVRKQFPKLKSHQNPDDMLRVSWLKNKQLGIDFSLSKVINIGYKSGLV